MAMELFESEQQEPSLAEVPRQPSTRERELREATRIPCRAWCPYCVSTRARGDYHSGSSSPEESAQREYATIQADFFYCEERKDEAKCVLTLVDCWTRYVHAEPLKIRNRRSVGESMARFLGNLGYSETVEIAVDNEPVLVAGMEFCKEARLRLGFSTGATTNKNYDTSRTSAAKRMIQTIRNLQKTLILQLEVNSVQDTRWTLHQILGHCPRSMALYSRYHVHSHLKITPFQAVTGRPYRGKLANFSQMVFGGSEGWKV